MTTHSSDPEENTSATGQTPIEHFLSLVPAKSYSRGYLACCPAHGDRNASLMIWEDETDRHVGLKCFVGCERAAICEAVGLAESDLYMTKGRHYKPASPARRLDLLDLAVHKLIHPNLLFSLQISDGYTWTTARGKQVKNIVRIPYFTEDGQEHPRARIRTALSAKDGSFWDGPETTPPIPYGLWKLQEARAAGYLWIVEGESDCWTNWQHQLPALGIPGATNVGKLEAAHLRDIPILYIVQEPTGPGKKVDAGKVFVVGLQRRLAQIGYQGQAYVVSLQSSHGVKDPNALHQQFTKEKRFKDYPAALQQAIHEAVPLTLAAACDASPEESVEVLQPLVEAAIAQQDANALYDLAPRFARLDTGERAKLLTPVKQGMGKQSGFSLQMLNMLMREARSDLERALRDGRVRITQKPDIILGRQQDEEIDDILDALYKANSPPVLFVRGGRLARCRCNEKGKPVIDPVDEYMLLDRMARVANFVTYSAKNDDYTDAHPPVSLARVILAKGEWNFPALEGITEVPVIRPDGTVLDTPGYDQVTHLMYIPQQDIDIPKVPDFPTPEEVQQARDFAWGFFAEFPYASRADAANAFALLLTPVTRSLYELVPLALVDSTKQGTGKGLLSKGVSVVGTGRSCASITQPETEEEWAKTLTSLLMEGNTIISIDNVERVLSSPKLASFLTSDYWKHRLLGTNQTPELLQRSIVMANGNNLQLGKTFRAAATVSGWMRALVSPGNGRDLRTHRSWSISKRTGARSLPRS